MSTAEFSFPDDTGQMHTLTGQESVLRLLHVGFLDETGELDFSHPAIRASTTLVTISLRRFGWSDQIYMSSGSIQAARASVSISNGSVNVSRDLLMLTDPRPIRVEIYIRSE